MVTPFITVMRRRRRRGGAQRQGSKDNKEDGEEPGENRLSVAAIRTN